MDFAVRRVLVDMAQIYQRLRRRRRSGRWRPARFGTRGISRSSSRACRRRGTAGRDHFRAGRSAADPFGREEPVAASRDERVLIIDIGGGSAEIILSENGRIAQAFSKPLGALRLQELFLRERSAESDRTAAAGGVYRGTDRVRLCGASARFRIDRVIGTSATASAVVCAVERIPRAKRDEADRLRASTPQIRKLYKESAGWTLEQRQKIAGIGPRRAEIIIPGTAVLLRVLEGSCACRRFITPRRACGTGLSPIWRRAVRDARLPS